MILRWAWFALALVALLVTAQETRYSRQPGLPVAVFDRWTHRFCYIDDAHHWVCGLRVP